MAIGGAVVTGAGSGIGRAAVARLLAADIEVVAVDIVGTSGPTLEAAGARFIQADVSDPAGRDAIATAARELASMDYLVNAAGIITVSKPLEVTLDAWRRVFSVNVEGLYFLCQALAPVIVDGGAIVNISSSSAKLATTIEVAPYAATKAAVLSITRSLAYALAPRRIRVNSICPGIVDTPMERLVLEGVGRVRGIPVKELSSARDSSVPLGRGSVPAEVAGVIAFLLSDDAAYITGEAMNFSGGQVMW